MLMHAFTDSTPGKLASRPTGTHFLVVAFLTGNAGLVVAFLTGNAG